MTRFAAIVVGLVMASCRKDEEGGQSAAPNYSSRVGKQSRFDSFGMPTYTSDIPLQDEQHLLKRIKSLDLISEKESRGKRISEILYTYPDIKSKLALFSSLPPGSDERTAVISSIRDYSFADQASLTLAYEQVPPGSDRSKIADSLVWSAFLEESDPAHATIQLANLDFVEEFDFAVVGLLGRPGFQEVAQSEHIDKILEIAQERQSNKVPWIEITRNAIARNKIMPN